MIRTATLSDNKLTATTLSENKGSATLTENKSGTGRMSSIRLLGARLVFGGALLGIWELVTRSGWVDRDFLPEPTAIASWLGEALSDGSIYRNAIATGMAMFLAFVIGSASGILVGVLFGQFQRVAAVVSPFIYFLNALPRVALAPLLILYLGISIWSKVSLGVSIVFFVLLLNTVAGLRSVDPDHVKLAKLNRFSARQVFWKVSLPTAVPTIFAGLKLSAVYSLLGVVVSEMVASTSGLGQLIIYNTNTFNIAGVYGTLFILAMLALILTSCMDIAERKLLSWQRFS